MLQTKIYADFKKTLVNSGGDKIACKHFSVRLCVCVCGWVCVCRGFLSLLLEPRQTHGFLENLPSKKTVDQDL